MQVFNHLDSLLLLLLYLLLLLLLLLRGHVPDVDGFVMEAPTRTLVYHTCIPLLILHDHPRAPTSRIVCRHVMVLRAPHRHLILKRVDSRIVAVLGRNLLRHAVTGTCILRG